MLIQNELEFCRGIEKSLKKNRLPFARESPHTSCFSSLSRSTNLVTKAALLRRSIVVLLV